MSKIENLLVNKGLYNSISITLDDLPELIVYLSEGKNTQISFEYLSENENMQNTIDCFCIDCGVNRVFEISNDKPDYSIRGMQGTNVNVFDIDKSDPISELFNSYLRKRYTLSYYCTRNREHFIFYDLFVTDNKVIKIGQYPSFADLLNKEIAKYKAVLGKQHIEFSKAIGLSAHGVGIGAFVYLRRIIEKLVLNKYEQVSEELGMSAKDFEILRFNEKINALKNYLPTVLVNNRNIYKIISKGIHELSEDECIDMFPFVKAGIEVILDDLIAKKEQAEKEKVFETFVSQKIGEINP